LPENLDFTKLDPVQSRLVLLHRKATITNVKEAGYLRLDHLCPKGIEEHKAGRLEEMCAGLWWHDLAAKNLDAEGLRKLKSGAKYAAAVRPKGSDKPERALAIFMSLPITDLAVIRGRHPEENARVEKVYERVASQSKVAVNLEDE
jgi:hypothetical protein